MAPTAAAEGAEPPERLLEDLVKAYYEGAVAASRYVRRTLDDLGVTEAAAGLIWLLDPARPPASMGELARSLACDPSNVTLIGDRLERSGHAVRHVNPDDARSRNLVLTDTGLALRRELVRRLASATPLATLSRTEQQQLLRLLHRTNPV